MSNVPSQQGKLLATLVLDDAVELAGHISSLVDGRLRLEVVQTADPGAGAPATLTEAGTFATLSLPPDGLAEAAPLEDARVKISMLQDDSMTLEFAPPDSEVAARYREAITAETLRDIPRAEEQPEPPAQQLGKALKGAATAARPPRKNRAMAVSADYARLLDAVRKRSLGELEVALGLFLADLSRHMQGLGARSLQGDLTDNSLNRAANKLEDGQDIIARQMLGQLRAYFDDLTPDASEDHIWLYSIGSSDELNLIDIEEFEDFLAIKRIVSDGEYTFAIPLEALTHRIAALIGEDPNKVRLPIDVRQLCRAFQSALQQVDVPHDALTHILDYFSRRFLEQLEGFYTPLNSLLADEGIKPSIESEIEAKGSMLKRNKNLPERKARERRRRRKPTDSPDGSPSQQQLEEELSRALGGPNPARLYRSVIDALNFKREAEGLADGEALASGVPLSGTWDGATVASSELDQSRVVDANLIAKALTALQRSSQAREEVHNSESLREYLARNKGEIGELKDSSGLTTESLNQLDMVDNLFGTIKSQLDVSTELKPSLGNLQIPLAKLALLDKKFFVDREHAARGVIDKLSSLATSGNFPNPALEDRINGIVDSIVGDYEHDESIFDTALEKIDKLVAQQERALARNKERVIRTQEGQEKLAGARREVNKVLASRIQPPSVPRVLQGLVDSGWRDLLVLTHLREGPDSAAWEEQIKALDLLQRWLDQRQHEDGEEDEDLRVQRSLEAESFIDLVGQQISSALPTNIGHEEVLNEIRDILAGNLEVDTVPVQPDEARLEPTRGDIRARIEDLPRLRRWVKRVEELETDCWLAYKDKHGQKKRMQLAWISPAKDRYIFVNARGQKVADFSAVRLARLLSRGVQPPTPTDDLSVVDQSMYHTLEHVQKTLSFARNHDSLTKMINSDTFHEQLSRAIRHSQLKLSQHAVLYLNIDQFSLVNEVYDQVSGDQVLLEFSKLLAQLHGRKSSSARLEGDDFAVLIIDRSIEQALELAESIRSAIEEGSVDIDGESVSFTVSIGVAAILEHSSSVEEVLDSARSAMRHAKQQGRNRVVKYEEEQSRIIDYKLEKTRTRKSLEDAIASERFVLRAQPIMQTQVSDRSNSTVHYELLLGLLDKDGSVSSPGEFIHSAERYGFMTLVDRWVVREAFTWISKLMDQQKVVPHLAINLSGTSVTDNSFMEYLLEQISEFGVGTDRLCFEITETGTISNLVKAADFVRAFRNIGCKFSIDDFGTGLASHNYLRELPVDYVKIDGSFITGIDKNRSDYAMARSINDLAHFLGQETIAESVENDTIIVKLEELGVDYLQGWGVGRPRPLADVTAELSSLEQ